MSASSDGGFIVMRVVVERDVDDAPRFLEDVLRFHEATGSRPDRINAPIWKRMTRAYKPATLHEAITNPALRRVHLWNRDMGKSESFLYLRDGDPQLAEFIDRALAFTAPGSQHLAAVLTLLRAIDDHYGVVGGGITGHATRHYADKEALQAGLPGTWDAETVERIQWDAWKWKKTRKRLLRLMPITIIGPTIWAGLPPLPALEPPVVVEELGRCKLLRAWPVLCPPRDPAFLRGTRALREWLWPYTIQNPSDALDRDPA